jgi:hypothetical protein
MNPGIIEFQSIVVEIQQLKGFIGANRGNPYSNSVMENISILKKLVKSLNWDY